MNLDDLQRRFEAERNRRANFDTMWQEIAERVVPAMADFNVQRAQGERRTEKLFDATAALAAQKAVSAISAFVWPSNQKYQKLTTSEPSLNKAQRVKVYLDEMTSILFDARYSPRAAFDAQMGQAALQHFVFGNGLMFIEDNIRQQAISYRAVHLAQAYLCEGSAGRVDSVYRCWKWPLRLIAQKWGEDRLPEKLRARLEKHSYEEHEVAHAVYPRTDYEPSKVGYPSMPWVSCYWLPNEKHHLSEGGFETWPFAVLRFAPSPGEAYGRGPAWMALSNIKVLNAQKKSILQAAQKVVDPPLLAYDDGIMGVFNQTPGAMNYGGLDSQGNQLVKPLITGADVRIGMDMMDKEREIIGSAFLMDVFRVLIENPQMTATQTLELLQERAIHMAQVAGRIESEGLGPMTERELDILGRAGQLPEMPPEMVEAQGEYQIEYTSPMRKAMRSSDAIAISRTMEQIAPLAQMDPSVMDVFDTHVAARELAEINGVPAKIIRDEDTLKALKEQRATDAQAAQLLEAAPAISQTAANLAKLQAAGGLVPGTA
jgi:hypothetical protein